MTVQMPCIRPVFVLRQEFGLSDKVFSIRSRPGGVIVAELRAEELEGDWAPIEASSENSGEGP